MPHMNAVRPPLNPARAYVHSAHPNEANGNAASRIAGRSHCPNPTQDGGRTVRWERCRSRPAGPYSLRMKSGLEIAQEATLRPIEEVAEAAGLRPEEFEPYGRAKAKVSLSVLERLADRPDGKIVITTAITPTKAGEGKTTSSISLTQGLARLGTRVGLVLREPSVGPVFGIKGGGTGGGYAQVL